MPYIKHNYRKFLDKALKPILQEFQDGWTSGELNYVLSKLIWTLFALKPSYQTINDLVGVLENVKFEFIRRHVADYENSKIKENGDLKIMVEGEIVPYGEH